MTSVPTPQGELLIMEIKEFASFPKKTQRYIRQSLDVAFNRDDALGRWGRTQEERQFIRNQMHNYTLLLDRIRRNIYSEQVSISRVEPIMGPLTALSTYDLSGGRLPHFASYRFLYERLLGGKSRVWLPSAYIAAAGSPIILPDNRRKLLQNISEAACTTNNWLHTDARFIPEWVDKVDTTLPPQLPAPTETPQG